MCMIIPSMRYIKADVPNLYLLNVVDQRTFCYFVGLKMAEIPSFDADREQKKKIKKSDFSLIDLLITH